MKLMLGNCLDRLKELDDNSVDSIVTDPPYGISFMGKKWDYDVPAVNIWEECFRVLKPGGHLLAFAGTRTQHRMAVNIEDAGFEIRDMIAWVYGSGFPKSMNMGKMVDKHLRGVGIGRPDPKSPLHGTKRQKIDGENAKHDMSPLYKTTQKEYEYDYEISKKWDGWGTALKPALEPITVARKPVAEKTVAENVLKYGTGAINIDESRVDTGAKKWEKPRGGIWKTDAEAKLIDNPQGRFPANLIHDGSDEVVELFPNTAPSKATNRGKQSDIRGDNYGRSKGALLDGSDSVRGHTDNGGSAARFFYCAKASKKDRDEGLDHMEEQQFVQWQTGNGASGKPSSMSEGRDTKRKNTHPTVKPTDLMKYLVRMVTPKGGVVLDPFMGSGSTGKAAKLEGFDFIGIEMDEEYFLLAKSRIDGIMVESTLEDFF